MSEDETHSRSADEISAVIDTIAETLTIDETNSVSFAGNGLKLDTSEDVEPIVKAINSCPQMSSLNLEGNTLGIEAAKQIGKSLESQSSLKYALLKDLFTGRLKTEIPEAILYLTSGIMLSNTKLHTLDLSDNAFGPIGMKSVLPFLQSQTCCDLQILRLNNNGLGIEGGKLLALGLTNLTQLKTFVCGRNRLEIAGAVAIGTSLAKITTLEILEMIQNGIRGEGIEAIAKAVEANQGLKVLNLNDNNLKGKGGQAIASALKKSTAIESINFGDCLLKRSGCVTLCEALNESENKNLREIFLSGNEIGGNDAIQSIIDLLSPERGFNVRLELNNNNFGQTGVDILKNSLRDRVDLKLSDDEGSDAEEDNNSDKDEPENLDEVEPNEDKNDLNDKSEVKNNIESENQDQTNLINDIEELSKTIENEYTDINDLCSQFVKISVDGYDNNNSKLNDEALKKSELFIKSAIKKEPNEYLSINSILVSLGLLKRDDGKYENVEDLRGPLSALTHSIKYLSTEQKIVLRAFMNRPNKSVEKCGVIKHSLMRALYI